MWCWKCFRFVEVQKTTSVRCWSSEEGLEAKLNEKVVCKRCGNEIKKKKE